MSKKTNPTSLRLSQKKSWISKSFFEDYNYSKLLYQDLYVRDYVKNVLQYQFYNSIIDDISIQRKKDNVDVKVSFYSNDQSVNFSSNNNSFGDGRLFFNLKKKHKWSLKKKIFFNYLQIKKNRTHKYQKYFVQVLKVKKQKKMTPMVVKMKLNKNTDYLLIFSLKRLIETNLALLTGCHVNLHLRNLSTLVNFPMFSRKALQSNNNINSVRKIMSFLKIRPKVSQLVGLDVKYLVHLIYTSFIFKSPNLLGVFISRVIKKNIKSFNFFFNFLSRTLLPLFIFSNLSGLKIQFKGRLGSSLRKRTSIILFGSMPLQSIDSVVNYSFNESITIYGVCGIKIWYYY